MTDGTDWEQLTIKDESRILEQRKRGLITAIETIKIPVQCEVIAGQMSSNSF